MTFPQFLEKKYNEIEDKHLNYSDWVKLRSSKEWIEFAEEYASSKPPISPAVAREKLDCIKNLENKIIHAQESIKDGATTQLVLEILEGK